MIAGGKSGARSDRDVYVRIGVGDGVINKGARRLPAVVKQYIVQIPGARTEDRNRGDAARGDANDRFRGRILARRIQTYAFVRTQIERNGPAAVRERSEKPPLQHAGEPGDGIGGGPKDHDRRASNGALHGIVVARDQRRCRRRSRSRRGSDVDRRVHACNRVIGERPHRAATVGECHSVQIPGNGSSVKRGAQQ